MLKRNRRGAVLFDFGCQLLMGLLQPLHKGVEHTPQAADFVVGTGSGAQGQVATIALFDHLRQVSQTARDGVADKKREDETYAHGSGDKDDNQITRPLERCIEFIQIGGRAHQPLQLGDVTEKGYFFPGPGLAGIFPEISYPPEFLGQHGVEKFGVDLRHLQQILSLHFRMNNGVALAVGHKGIPAGSEF